jgi:hypothetical protein
MTDLDLSLAHILHTRAAARPASLSAEPFSSDGLSKMFWDSPTL